MILIRFLAAALTAQTAHQSPWGIVAIATSAIGAHIMVGKKKRKSVGLESKTQVAKWYAMSIAGISKLESGLRCANRTQLNMMTSR